MSDWVCEDCFDRHDECCMVKMIPNAVGHKCVFCGKIAKYLTVLTDNDYQQIKKYQKEKP